jgi:hypothetical protein
MTSAGVRALPLQISMTLPSEEPTDGEIKATISSRLSALSQAKEQCSGGTRDWALG